MQKNIIFHYAALLSCLLITGACFLPWIHINSINQTLTGYNVTKFPSGAYYGKAGIIITVLASIIFLLNLWKSKSARSINLFICALLVAYAIRTYIIFTGSLFEGEVKIYAGMYAVVLLAFIILICGLFPRLYVQKATDQ